MSSPYIPFYTSDFLGGTGGMTAATKGVYITLLCLMYEAEEPLPQKWDVLARRCGCTLPAFKKAVEALEDDAKIIVDDGAIWSEKCEKHIAQRRERSDSARAAAKIRHEKTKQKQRNDNADAHDPQCDRNANQNQNQNHNNTIGDFDEFWSECPRKIGKDAALKSWKSALKRADAQSIIEGMKRHAREVQGREKQYIPHPSTWLNAGRWQDESQDATISKQKATDHDRLTNIATLIRKRISSAITPQDAREAVAKGYVTKDECRGVVNV